MLHLAFVFRQNGELSVILQHRKGNLIRCTQILAANLRHQIVNVVALPFHDALIDMSVMNQNRILTIKNISGLFAFQKHPGYHNL